MTALTIGAVVALAACGVTMVVASCAVQAVWGPIANRLDLNAPASRARVLMMLRLTPAGASGMTGALVLIAFMQLEPANAREVLGFVLPATALLTIGVIGCRLAAAVRAWRETRQTVVRWMPPGTPESANARRTIVASFGETSPGTLERWTIENSFPVVAVVGIWRPRLFIARQVLDACDGRELDAVIAHEAAHIRAFDNLTRLLFVCSPFVGRSTAQAIEYAWSRASEEAADDVARLDAGSSLALASALTKVARLAGGQPMPALHASAILSRSGLEERVCRLLDGRPRALEGPRSRLFFVPIAAAVTVLLSPAALRHIYAVVEFCVRTLP